MRKLLLFAPLAIILVLPFDVFSQRGNRDGQRGEGGGRGNRPDSPTPSFNRPNDSRPDQTPTTRPGLIPESRPNRPVDGGNRPGGGGGGGNRPDRPGAGGAGGGNRPNVPDRPGTGAGNRPTRPGLIPESQPN